jgi:hypothetical protein
VRGGLRISISSEDSGEKRSWGFFFFFLLLICA